jgi:hypothetical protein
MHRYRSFHYLDEAITDDFLAGVELLRTEETTETQENSSTTSGKLGVGLIEGEREGIKKEIKESTHQIVVSPAGKFQRLYEHLIHEIDMQYYVGIDLEGWSQLSRGDLCEIQALISVGKFSSANNSIMNIGAWVSAAQTMGYEAPMSEKDKALIATAEKYKEIESREGIPIVLSLINSSRYKFVTHINPTWLRVGIDKLRGEVSALIKIQRKLTEREKYELFDPLASLDHLPLGRTEKRKLQHSKSAMPQTARETIRYPAAIVSVIAIYT